MAYSGARKPLDANLANSVIPGLGGLPRDSVFSFGNRVGVFASIVSKDLDLTDEFIKWLPDEKAAWQWLGDQVGASRSGGRLAFRPSKPESFRCSHTKKLVSLRTGTILEGRLPLRKWLLALLLIADQRCLPKCQTLSEKLGLIAEPNHRGTSISGAFKILKALSRARVKDAASWWRAIGKPGDDVLPWLLVSWLAQRFALGDVTKSGWKSWVSRRTPYRDEESQSKFDEQHDNLENFLRYLVETKPYDIKVQERLQKRCGKRTRSATWFTLRGLHLVPRELWFQTISDGQHDHSPKRSPFPSPVAVYRPSPHIIARAVKLLKLEKPFDSEDLVRAGRLWDEVRSGSRYLEPIALIDKFVIPKNRGDNIEVSGCHVIRAKIPGRPLYLFCSKGDPGQNAYDRLIEDLVCLENYDLHVLTRCERFRKPPVRKKLRWLRLRISPL